MTTYRAAYAQTIANIYDRILTLRKTTMTLQKTLNVPDRLWSRLYPNQRWSVMATDKKADLYVESQLKLNYLTDLILFIERDQVQALPEELDDFFVKRDLYWWESTLSLVGSPAYLEQEIIAPAYTELARTAKTAKPPVSGKVACPAQASSVTPSGQRCESPINSVKKMNEP